MKCCTQRGASGSPESLIGGVRLKSEDGSRFLQTLSQACVAQGSQ